MLFERALAEKKPAAARLVWTVNVIDMCLKRRERRFPRLELRPATVSFRVLDKKLLSQEASTMGSCDTTSCMVTVIVTASAASA